MSSRESGKLGLLGSSAIRKPGDDQPDDVRQAQPPREHRDQTGDEQQNSDRGEGGRRP